MKRIPEPAAAESIDYHTLLKQLREDLVILNRTIAALERYQHGTGTRRGRPPKWLERKRVNSGRRSS